MQPQSSHRPRPRGRWGWASTILILLFSLYPISLSARSGNGFSVALLVALDALLIAVRIVVARKSAALPRGDTDDRAPGIPGR